jgi:hypothetical protein
MNGNEKAVYRRRVATMSELIEVLGEVNYLYPEATGEKYVKANGAHVLCVAVVESTLTDGSTVRDIHLATEIEGKEGHYAL